MTRHGSYFQLAIHDEEQSDPQSCSGQPKWNFMGRRNRPLHRQGSNGISLLCHGHQSSSTWYQPSWSWNQDIKGTIIIINSHRHLQQIFMHQLRQRWPSYAGGEWGIGDKKNECERESSARTHSQIASSGRSSAIEEAANIEFFISTSGLESYIWKGDIRLNIL